MEHIIAYNPYKNGNKGSVSSQPLSVYDKTIAYPWMADLVAAIRGGNDELKKQLPFRCAHYYQFRDNRRSQKNAVPESFLFQTTIDVDDKEYVDKAIEKARELNCSDTIWNGALLHLEYSARKKLHIDIRMPVGMTIEETQRAYCEALGVPYDESCITPERMLFITDKASEIYRSPHWYEVLPQEELKKRRQAYLDRGLTIDGRAGKVNSLQLKVNSNHKVQSSNFQVQSKDHVQDHRLSGSEGKEVLHDINLTVCKDDYLGIIGPNGGGKTTLMRLILGLMKPTDGSIRFYKDGEEVREISMGYLPQYNHLDKQFPISVYEVVLSGLSKTKSLFSRYTQAQHQQVLDCLEQMQLTELKDRHIAALSGGQLQRVLLARAIVSKPDVVILDEPNTYIDRRFQKQMYEMLEQINRECAIIIVSHDVAEVLNNVKHIACVNHHLHYHDTADMPREKLEEHFLNV